MVGSDSWEESAQDRQDNRIENLQLRNGLHGKGTRLKCLACGSHNVEAVAL